MSRHGRGVNGFRSAVRRTGRGYRVGQSHHRSRYPDAVVNTARQLRDEGLSVRKVARALEVPASTVQDWLDYGTRP